MSEYAKIKRCLKLENILMSTASIVVMMRATISHYAKYRSNISFYDKIKFLDLPLSGLL